MNKFYLSLWALFASSVAVQVFASTDGSITGTVTDPEGVAVQNAQVTIHSAGAKKPKSTPSSITGEFQFFPLNFGDYLLEVDAQDFSHYSSSVHVGSGGATHVDVHLARSSSEHEIVVEVKAKRHLVSNSSSTSAKETTHEEIEALPQGSDISLPRLLAVTNPGVVQGAFNQTFIRGNHANIQYQIDGVQLPDSTAGTFAEAFSTRNIDHMEFIAGGLPAEYGERDAAVVNIITRSGPENPNGSAELNYGSYSTFNPQMLYGGSTPSGQVHYFVSAAYNSTDRGLDTPNPSTTALDGQTQGDTGVTHDQSNGNNQFFKIDWLPNNDDKYSLIGFQNYNFYQIPNFPSTASYTDSYFAANQRQPYADAFGNVAQADNSGIIRPLFNYTPPTTNDTQSNLDAYAELVWKHTFSERSFLQVAPYWKYSKVKFGGDAPHDLASAQDAAYFIPYSTPSSFSINRHINNEGIKADYTLRPDEQHLIKSGVQFQGSRANAAYSITGATAGSALSNTTLATSNGGGIDRGLFEDAYVQDDWTLTKQWTINAGVRYTAYQFNFPSDHASAQQLQPRIGVSFSPNELTRLHAYYGRLFTPAPLEDLREAFNVLASTPASYYDIKPEKDDYFELGVDRQVAHDQVVSINGYEKLATDMLDDTQLLNTSIATPYNFEKGYAYGIEASVKGKITEQFSEFFNYSFEKAGGKNISGGTFAVAPSSIPANTYLWLDHVQVSTANAGVSYTKNRVFASVDGQWGSGLRTGANNTKSLPSHFSADLTGGYTFSGESWLCRWKVQADILNVFNNVYPISIANGFNGSHYAAGREFFARLTKEL